MSKFVVKYTYWKKERLEHGWTQHSHSYTHTIDSNPSRYICEVERHAMTSHYLIAMDFLAVYKDGEMVWSKDYTNVADSRKRVPLEF